MTHRARRCVLAGLVTLLVALASPAAVIAQPAMQETFPLLDAVIGNYLPRVATFQSTYLLGRGRYFQALWSHADVPDESANLEPNQLTSRPTDQLETFGDMWIAGGVRIGQGRLPLRFRIDVYAGPCGQGYVISIEVTRLGVTYTRTINVGCETWRDEAWRAVTVTEASVRP